MGTIKLYFFFETPGALAPEEKMEWVSLPSVRISITATEPIPVGALTPADMEEGYHSTFFGC